MRAGLPCISMSLSPAAVFDTWADIEQVATLAGRRPRAVDFEPATFSLGLLGHSNGCGGPYRRAEPAATSGAPPGDFFRALRHTTDANTGRAAGALQPSTHEMRERRVVNALHAGWLLKALGAVEKAADKTFAFMAGTFSTAQPVKMAVTTLLRCLKTHCQVTPLLRNPWKPASLLGSGRSAIVVNGGVTTLVSQL